MKKLISLLTLCCAFFAASATDYTGHLKVTINNESAEQDSVVIGITQQEDGAYTLNLDNFILVSDDVALPVGNIVVTDVKGTEEYGYTTIHFNDSIAITPGNDPKYTEDEWIGPLLGKVLIDMTSRFTSTAINVGIDIDLSATLGQIIEVEFFGVAPATSGETEKNNGDVNEDGDVNIGDVNGVVSIILGAQN